MAILNGARSVKVTGQTTNATPTAFDLIDLAAPGFCEAINGQGVYVELVVVAQSTGDNVAGGKIGGTFKRISGTLSLLGTPAALYLTIADLAVASILPAASGTKIQAAVTGIAATTINYTFHLQLWSN